MPTDTHDRIAALRALPSVERLSRHPTLAGLEPLLRVEAARYAIIAARDTIQAADLLAPSPNIADDTLAAQALAWARSRVADTPLQIRRAVNATGVLLHTNLGRATLAPAAVAAVHAVASGHAALEIDDETGGRGSRQTACADLLCELTGAEDTLVVNNNAAATFLAIHVLAANREVILSRGQLVEIGGQFRLPDVIESAGARLREVGTTNRTRITDYERALCPETAMLLRVHPSNFRIVGFAEEASLAQLVALGRAHNIPVGDDIGSGALVDLAPYGLTGEPSAPDSIVTGADLVWFSGDKLLGGPQAGILIGRRDLIAAMARHPLARALRPDKLTLAALEATLRLYRANRAWDEVPTLRRLRRAPEDILAAAGRVARRLRAIDATLAVDLVATESQIGGGSLPGHTLPSWAVALTPTRETVSHLARRLRRAAAPIYGRIEKGIFLLDLRAVDEDEEEIIAETYAVSLETEVAQDA